MGAPAEPLAWRVPPWQPAGLFVLAAAASAAIRYAPVGAVGGAVLAVLGAVAFAAGVLDLRMLLAVTVDGVFVRRLLATRYVPWPQVADVRLVDLRQGASTVRVVLVDGTALDAPAALLQPAVPRSTARVRGDVQEVVRRINEFRSTLR